MSWSEGNSHQYCAGDQPIVLDAAVVPCHMEQPALRKLYLLVEFPGGLEPAECSIPSTLAFVDIVFDTGRPTTVKVATVCYPVCLVGYLVELDRVFATLVTVFEDAVPTPVC